VPALRSRLNQRPGIVVGAGDDPLDAPVALLTPTEAKGLEFDAVVLVEPAELAGRTTAGLRGLYVALTRATRFLAVVHHRPLPEPLQPFAAVTGRGSGPG
jgi:DNA helicase IV